MSNKPREIEVTAVISKWTFGILKEQAEAEGRSLEGQIRHALAGWVERHGWGKENSQFEYADDEMVACEIPAHLYRRIEKLAKLHQREIGDQIIYLLYESHDERIKASRQVRSMDVQNKALKNALKETTALPKRTIEIISREARYNERSFNEQITALVDENIDLHRRLEELENEATLLRAQLGEPVERHQIDYEEFEARHPYEAVTDDSSVLSQALSGRAVKSVVFVSAPGEDWDVTPSICLWLDNGRDIAITAVPDGFDPEQSDVFGALDTIKRGSPKLVWSVCLLDKDRKSIEEGADDRAVI